MVTGKTGMLASVSMGLLLASSAGALTDSYLEGFDTGDADWEDAINAPVDYIASGGADGGGYISTTEISGTGFGTIQFRANAADGASGGEFTGDWQNITRLSAFVRHDAFAPVNAFFRITGPAGPPPPIAHVGVVPIPVLPNVWTEISVDVFDGNPLLINEGPGTWDFDDTFGNVVNLQVGFVVPEDLGLEFQAFTWDLDSVQIVPEPSTALLLGVGLLALGARRGRAV